MLKKGLYEILQVLEISILEKLTINLLSKNARYGNSKVGLITI